MEILFNILTGFQQGTEYMDPGNEPICAETGKPWNRKRFWDDSF